MGRRVTTGLVAAAATFALGTASASADVSWLCLPGAASNPCEIGQDTTYQEQGGGSRVETPASGPREVDCFYVYPTTSNQLTPNATQSRDPELVSIAKYQAARFSQQCRVFAPIYRQITLTNLTLTLLGIGGGDRSLAYGDVVEAWREYLAKYNGGRGVVLIGHSQGTFMLRELIRQEIEPNPAQHRKLVSGLLLGGNVNVAAGKNVGGDFAKTPLCTSRAELGCVVAYSTFFDDPGADPRFGVPPSAGLEVACTDPRPLAGQPGPMRITTPSEPFAPGLINLGILVTALPGLPPTAPTTWVSPPDTGDGGCRTIDGAHVLRLEPTPGSRRPGWYPTPGWGTHLIDVNATLDPLVSLVRQQAARWSAPPDVSLARRCKKGRLRVRLRAPDLGVVKSVVFRLGKREYARGDGAEPRVTIGKRALKRTKSRKLRATVELRHGATETLELERRAPRRCGRKR